RRSVGHNGNASALKQVRDRVFLHVTGELQTGIILMLGRDGGDVAWGLGVIAARNRPLNSREFFSDPVECRDEQFQARVRSPFAKCQNTVNRVATPGEVRIFRPPGKNSMWPNKYGATAVLLPQHAAIGR